MKKDSELYKKIKVRCYIVGLIAFLTALIVGVFLLHNLEKDEKTTGKYMAQITEKRVRARLDQYSMLSALLGNYISAGENLDENTFSELAEKIPNEDGVIKAFELAPEGIVTDIYPKQGNEGAFGLDVLRMMNKPILLMGALLASTSVELSAQKNRENPNIVFVLADDMGIGDLGCYGQKKIKTPNIDQLAEKGLLFTNHYSGSTVSAPSRCCLLTGKHTGHAYIRGNKGIKSEEGFFDLHLPEEEVTVAEVLKEKGYATMCVGKWGLGGPHTTGSPVRKGFDYFFGYLSQGAAHRYYPEYLYENEDKVMLNKKVYSHFLIMEKGLNFIRENAHHPFFAYFAITPPHADLDYPDLGQYEDAFPETPFINNKQKGFKTQMKPKAAYASMVSEIDKNVGQIIRLLKEKGIWENTIFIFSSDNGVHCVGGHEPDFFDSNGPYRGYKRDLYEGGVRAPFIVNWPKMIKEKKTVEHITAFWDFLPTVTELVGAEKVKGIDGISYLPLLIGNGDVARNHEYIYYEFYEQGGKQSILKDGWKLVRLNMSKPGELQEELYYLPDDVGEEKNLIRQNSQKADELRKLAMKARTESEYFKWEEKK